MRRFALILVFVFALLASAGITNAQGALDTLQNAGVAPRSDVNPMNSFDAYKRQQVASERFLLNDAEIISRIAGANSFLDLFTVIYDFVVTLAALWAVLVLVYLGAKYALVDSVTGKQMAKENMLPVVIGLVALLGSYILFKQINPQLVDLKIDLKNSDFKLQSAIPDAPVNVKNAEKLISEAEKARERQVKREVNQALLQSGINKNIDDLAKLIGKPNDFCKSKEGPERVYCRNIAGYIVDCSKGGESGCYYVKKKTEDIKKYILNNNSG